MLDFTDKIGPTRLFRNRKTGKRFLAATESNDDVIYAELDENDKSINAGNRFTKEEYNIMLDDLDMEAEDLKAFRHRSVFYCETGDSIKPQAPAGVG